MDLFREPPTQSPAPSLDDQREVKFRAIVENSHDGILFTDANAVIQYRSPSYQQINGFADHERLGHSGFETVHPEDMALVRQAWAQALAHPEVFRGVCYRIQHKDGTWRWVESSIKSLLGVPNVDAVVVTTRDITERKRVETDLRERQMELAAAQRLAHIGSWQWSVGTDDASWSDETFRIFGQPHGRLEQHGTRFLEMIHPDDRPRVRQALTAALGGAAEYDLEYRVRRPDGEERTIHGQAEVLRDEAGRPTLMRGTVHDITERKRADLALQASEARYRDFVLHTHEGVWRYELEKPLPRNLPEDESVEWLLRYAYMGECNLAHARDIGFSGPEEVLGKYLGEMVPATDTARLRTMHEAVRAGWQPRTIEYEATDPMGNVQYLRRTEVPIIQHDRLVRIWGTTEDVTARRRAEQALHASEERFRTLIEKAPIAIGIGRNGLSVYANQKLLEMYGFRSVEELAGRPIVEHWAPVSRGDIEERLRRRPTGVDLPTDYEGVAQRQDGSQFPVHSEVTTVNLPDGPATLLFVTDVTEQKRAQEQLQLLKYSIDTAPDGAYWMDRHGRFIYVNEAGCKELGYTLDELIQMSVLDVNPRASSARWEEFWCDIKQHKSTTMQSVHRRKDGSEFPVEITSTYFEFGDREYCNGFAKDITERQRAREKLEESLDQVRALAARLQSVREEESKRLAREMHDQLGQALTAIRLDVSSLIAEMPSGPLPGSQKAFSILKLVDETIHTVRRISSELRPGMLDDLGLVATLEWAVEDFRARTRIPCALDLPQEDIPMAAERATAIYRILQEILTNVARHAAATQVEVQLTTRNQDVILMVHDNGKGMPADKLPRRESLGILGMQERALAFEGEIIIASAPGMGTTVRVRIPEACPANEDSQ